ncbi:MAG: beta-lactamase family protein, partial [Gammaproteobacteria bacterium]|nr:beta-lactamase family protein [Gammaproteobacteria bacterium]
MKIKSSIISLALMCSFTSPILCADEDNGNKELNKQMQKIVNEYYKTYSNSELFTAVAASVLIPHDKMTDINDIQTVVTGTMGVPPLNQAITSKNLFDIGSITKSFTAAILLQLQAEDRLSLDDTLGKWLPQYPNWKDVTLRQLLNMTSGIPNYSEDPEMDKIMLADLSHVWTNEELLKYAHPEKPLKVNKENYYEYCNSNYILAALVIEKATQDSFENQLKKRITNSNNQLNTAFYPAGADGVAVGKEIINQRVHGYFYDEKNNKLIDTIVNDLSWAGAAGAIVATTEDVVRWVQMLYHGTVFDSASREKTLTDLKSVVSVKTGRPISTVTEEEPGGFGLGVAYRYDKE